MAQAGRISVRTRLVIQPMLSPAVLMLGGRTVKQIYELRAEGQSVRAIARLLGVARNSVRKYLRADEIPKAQPRPARGSKLDPFRAHLEQRVAEGIVNCVVLLRE